MLTLFFFSDITVESQNKEQTEPELADMEMMEERKKRQAK